MEQKEISNPEIFRKELLRMILYYNGSLEELLPSLKEAQKIISVTPNLESMGTREFLSSALDRL